MSENQEVLEQNLVKQENSNFRSLTITTRTSSSVVLNWNYENDQFKDSTCAEFVFKLLKLQSRNEWITTTWTRRSSCTIENLEQNVCYSMQLLVLLEGENEFEIIDQSEIFKVSSLAEKVRFRHQLTLFRSF